MPMLNPPPVKKTREERSRCRSCPREKYKGVSNVDCYWHWLVRQPPAAQDVEVWLRMEGPPQVNAHEQDGAEPCSSCGWRFPDFYKPARGRMCKGCLSFRKYASHAMITYGLDEEAYIRLFKLQKGKCAICRHRQLIKRLAIDHDHETGDVRGLLCQGCNEDVLGSLGGDTRKVLPLLKSAVRYLETYPAAGSWVRPELADARSWSAAVTPRRPIVVSILGDTESPDEEPAPF